MSLNAFGGATLSADKMTVIVNGHTDPTFAATQIEVAVIAVDDDNKRLQGPVTDPGLTRWDAPLSQADLPADGRFDHDDKIMLVGLARTADGESELWGGVVQEGLPEVLPVSSLGLKT
jgi:hypothetical protein